MWNENFKFHVHVPELALVRFVVEDYDAVSSNDFVGQCTVPFTSLQNGQSSTASAFPRFDYFYLFSSPFELELSSTLIT